MKIILKDSIDNDLWKRDLYTANIDYIISANIYEYDMKSAGYNLIKYYELKDESTLSYLKSLEKGEMNRQIGLFMREDLKFNKALTEAFGRMRKKFFSANNIMENQVLSIKKDAIFLINKQCEETKFDNVEFVLKNRYTSYHSFDKYEFFYRNRGNILDVKGINDEKLKVHEEYMLSFLKETFNLLETSDNQRVVNKIKKFASMYKNKKLPVGYYRELNSGSMFNLVCEDENVSIQAEECVKGFEVNHTYNYMTYILRLIQRYFFISGV